MPRMPAVARRTLLVGSTLTVTAAALGVAPTVTNAEMCEGIAADPGPAELLVFGGQSNAGPAGMATPLLGSPYPCQVVTFSTGQLARGAHELDRRLLSDLGPLDGGAEGKSMVGSATGFAIEADNRAHSRTSPGYLVFTAMEGGVPLTDLIRGAESEGHYSFANTIGGVERARAVLADHGRDSVCQGYFFIHGENGPAPGQRGIPAERRLYARMLDDYIDDVTRTIQRTLDQAQPPHFFLVQINSADTKIRTGQADPYNVGAVLAQLDVAHQRLGAGVTLAGPAYQVQVSDNIHHDSRGRLMLGELFALAYRRVTQGHRFTPLWPTRAAMQGNQIDVTFDLPGGPLTFDTDWVKPVPHQGFGYLDDAESARITSVRLTGTDTVRITLDRTPTGPNPRIRYACGNENPGRDDQWSAARGQLYSDSGITSHYAARFGIPPTIRHYAVRFELPTRPG